MKITEQEMRDAFHEVERIKARLNTLYFKMEEAEGEDGDQLLGRYVAAKEVVSDASDRLLDAVDLLRAR